MIGIDLLRYASCHVILAEKLRVDDASKLYLVCWKCQHQNVVGGEALNQIEMHEVPMTPDLLRQDEVKVEPLTVERKVRQTTRSPNKT